MEHMGKKALLILLMLILQGRMMAGPLLVIDSFSARSFALGSATVADTVDAGNMSINPAGLMSLRNFHLDCFYLPWINDMRFFSISSAIPVKDGGKKVGVLGVGISVFSMTPFANYDSRGNTLNDLEASDFLLDVVYAKSLMKGVGIGAGLKYLETRLSSFKTKGLALDIGAQAKVPIVLPFLKDGERNLKVGLTIQNIGMVQNVTHEEGVSLADRIRLGMSCLIYRSMNFSGTYMLALEKNRDQHPELNTGVELKIFNDIQPRFGLSYSRDMGLQLAYGVGVVSRLNGFDLRFNYSLLPIRNFGASHALELSWVLSEFHVGVPTLLRKMDFQDKEDEESVIPAGEKTSASQETELLPEILEESGETDGAESADVTEDESEGMTDDGAEHQEELLEGIETPEESR